MNNFPLVISYCSPRVAHYSNQISISMISIILRVLVTVISQRYDVREFLASYDATPVMVMATIPVASKRICGLAVRDEIFFGRLGGKFEKLRNLNLS